VSVSERRMMIPSGPRCDPRSSRPLGRGLSSIRWEVDELIDVREDRIVMDRGEALEAAGLRE
jgi:hypothetical protein